MCPLMLAYYLDQSCSVGNRCMLLFLFSSICFLLTVGYHLQLQIPVWPCCLYQRLHGLLEKVMEGERERGEAGGVGEKGRILRDRMSRKICKLSDSVFLYRSFNTLHHYTWETKGQPTKSGTFAIFSYYKCL